MQAVGAGLECAIGRKCAVDVLDTVSGTWSTLKPGTPLPTDIPTRPCEVLCEYREQPSVRYTSGEV